MNKDEYFKIYLEQQTKAMDRIADTFDRMKDNELRTTEILSGVQAQLSDAQSLLMAHDKRGTDNVMKIFKLIVVGGLMIIGALITGKMVNLI